jgi:23S rRNA (uracil1939-C5)-methyltransferase
LPFEFSPVKLVYGGEALGYYAGRTVMAPRVLPGERAEMEEIRTQKGLVHARPLRIIQPSSERVEPPCPYFGRCGGCQYQHLATNSQVLAKREILRETLRRLGRIPWDGEIPIHSGPAWHYRNQARLKVGRAEDGSRGLGFFAAESNQLISIESCAILSPHLNALLSELPCEAWTGVVDLCQEIELLADDRDEKVMLILHGSWAAPEVVSQKCLAGLAGVVTVAVDNGSGLQVFGEPHLTYRVGEYAYRVSPTAFFQSSRFLLPQLVASVTGAESGGVAMDLFAGVGLFTLPLAQHFAQVMAVESHPQAAADLAANAHAAPGGQIRVMAETASDFLRRCALAEPDLVVLDPPRAGVGVAALRRLAALRPKRLIYVSCSPPTLARDLGFLLQHGYKLDAFEMFDLFPQTYHIEALARLSAKGEVDSLQSTVYSHGKKYRLPVVQY